MKRALFRLSLIVCVFGYIGCSVGEMMYEENYSYSGVHSLTVEGSFFAVEVVGGSGSTLEAQVLMPQRLRRRKVTVIHEKNGDDVRVRVERKGLFSRLSSSGKSRMIFRVPADTVVDIQNSSGSVSVAGISADELRVKASSGEISVNQSNSDLIIKSSSGNISVSSCEGFKTLAATSGDISVQESNGSIEGETSSGEQRYIDIYGDIKSESSSGNIEIKNAVGSLDLRASSGDIEGNEISITANSSFKTSSGAIDMRFTNNIEDFSFDLQSSSGRISVGKTRAEGTVKVGNGELVINGKSSSGRQTYR